MENNGNAEAQGASESQGTSESAGNVTAPIIDEKGNFREGWTEILDEDLRNEPYIQEAKNIQGMARSVVSARSMVGRNKIAIPNENSSQEEWDEYYKISGWPGDAEYGLKRPDDFPEEFYREDKAQEAFKLFNDIRLNKKQAEAVFNFHNQMVLDSLKEKKTDDELALDNLKDELAQDWGAAYDQKVHLGNIAVETGATKKINGVDVVDEDYKARLLEKINKDPDLIRFTSNLGAKFSEHKSIIPETAVIPTPSEIDQKIEDAMNDEAFTNNKHPRHKTQVALVTKLHKQKFESKARTR
jgi:hypothetical protein